eukprot:Blabericola_migrator_1__733@NODE_1182_length_5200_cov_33_557763_g804_i0_p1_GENE_NODE_1182_length_5200_cov_33_557763_g804_i0NODE_1182_length_5200_cov_33_557763_g804_i0_p1_ORF_typecomplete_len130_score7_65zfB_box/PF00643_24/0_051zfB_box/PF00643_24/6_8e03_NODE_1182_length_5200_cov_33_557763_g804_i044344823
MERSEWYSLLLSQFSRWNSICLTPSQCHTNRLKLFCNTCRQAKRSLVRQHQCRRPPCQRLNSYAWSQSKSRPQHLSKLLHEAIQLAMVASPHVHNVRDTAFNHPHEKTKECLNSVRDVKGSLKHGLGVC